MGRKSKREYKNKLMLKKFYKVTFFSLVIFCIFIFLHKLYFTNTDTGNTNKSKITKSEAAKKDVSNSKKVDNNNNDNNSTNNQNSSTKETAKNTTSEILMSFAGDCTLGTDTSFQYVNSLPYVFKSNNNDLNYFFKNVSYIFKGDDYTVVNLETTLTDANKKAVKTFKFKGDPIYAKCLKVSSIEAVNLSNNHIYDYLQQGYSDTIDALNKNQVGFFGEGHILNLNIKNQKFCFLGYQGWVDSKEFLEKLKEDITSAKDNGCTVIVTFHWGLESQYEPYSVQKNIAHFAIDNGADLIIGHHPHVIQSIEEYKNKVICYSLGNFCFGGNVNPKDKDTFIFQTKFKFINNELSSYETKVIPCSISSKSYINDYCPTPLTGDNETRVLNKIQNVSPDFKNNVKNVFIQTSN